jgi:hypothetical protein
LPQKRLLNVPFFHIVYIKAISTGVQLPESTLSMPPFVPLAAISKSINIQRQLLQPPFCEKRFMIFLL